MRKLSTRERVLLAILVVVAVVSGYVLLFSMPLNEKIQTLGQEIMESEDLKHIFERLYKCDRARSEKGSGLGLSIARQLTEKMGGRITVQSQPGKGTRFTLTFPLCE